MPWERLEPSGAQPQISLRKSAGIGINQTALDQFFEDAKSVNIQFNKEENMLGLEPVSEKSEGDYTLTRSNSGGSVTPKSWLNRLNLIPRNDEGQKITKRYDPEMIESGDGNQIVAIDLDKPVDTYGKAEGEEEDGE